MSTPSISWANPNGSGLKPGLNWLGLTDTDATNRAWNALSGAANSAGTELDSNLSGVNSMFSDAMNGRSINQNLDTYDSRMNNEMNAGSSENVQKFVNPNQQNMLNNTMQRMQGSTGASLQSSGAANATANALANQSGQLWNDAYSQAMANSSNNQNIANNQLNADNTPALSWGQLQADTAMNKYNTQMQLANTQGQLAGQSQSWLQNLMGGL